MYIKNILCSERRYMPPFTPPKLSVERLNALQSQLNLSHEEIQGLVDELHEKDMLNHVEQVMHALPDACEALLAQLEDGGTAQ
jgi:hypothetical protein